MKKFLLFQVVLLVTFLFVRPDMAHAEADSFSGQTASVWIEEGESVLERLDETGDVYFQHGSVLLYSGLVDN